MGERNMQMIETSEEFRPIIDYWTQNAQRYAKTSALIDDYNKSSYTYAEAYRHINLFAAALQSLGVKKGDHISQFSENSAQWMIADQALLMSGVVNAVRGSQAPLDELKYIYNHSDSKFLIVENFNLLNKLYSVLSDNLPQFVVILLSDSSESKKEYSIPVYTFDELIELGEKTSFTPVQNDKDDVATIVYSSGTTGRPKGIMLTHGNISSQIKNIHPGLRCDGQLRTLNVLPIWHMYQRTCEYYLLSRGCTMHYTNVRNFKKDLKAYRPQFVVAVPRIWASIYDGVMSEINSKDDFNKNIFNFFFNISQKHKKAKRVHSKTCIGNLHPSRWEILLSKIVDVSLYPIHTAACKHLYSKIHQAVGGEFIKGISGGGALAKHVEDFFEAVEIDLYVGYGLTETAPVLCVRNPENNKIYSTGPALSETKIMIVSPETLLPLKSEEKGLVLAKGPQIMKGYYKDAEATEKVILKNGWFITGDLGWLSVDDTLTLTGRIKDTIVLSNGENIEPDSIEEVCLSSPFVKQIVLVGQDKSSLGALITPNIDEIERWAQKNNLTVAAAKNHPEFIKLVHKEISSKVQGRPNFRPFERISCLRILDEDFSIDNGLLTHTAKIRKHEVCNRYKDIIEDMYA